MTTIEAMRIRTCVASTPDGEVLVSIFPQGRVTVAFRAEQWHAWGVPYTAEDRP